MCIMCVLEDRKRGVLKTERDRGVLKDRKREEISPMHISPYYIIHTTYLPAQSAVAHHTHHLCVCVYVYVYVYVHMCV
jgi:hypothetical protein